MPDQQGGTAPVPAVMPGGVVASLSIIAPGSTAPSDGGRWWQ
jgi:hypothetical protein